MFSIFFTVFSLVFLAMQSYMLLRVWRAFPWLGHARWLLVVWGLAMLSGIWVYNLRQRPAAMGWLADVAYVWMVVLFWFLVAGLIGDLWNALAGLGGVWLGGLRRLVIPPPALTGGVLALVAMCLVWSVIEARNVRLVQLSVSLSADPIGRTATLSGPTDAADPATDPATQTVPAEALARPIRIVQISDLHLTAHSDRQRLARLVAQIEELKPDLIVATGDMIDAAAAELTDFSDMLARLDPPLGKLAVMGNHEWYVGQREAAAFHENAGFTLLRGQWVRVGNLHVAGVEDPTAARAGVDVAGDEAQALAAADGHPVILLKHRPAVQAASAGKFHLQLSGHAHGGQVFPFSLVSRLANPNLAGRYAVPGGGVLYVSRGTGTWGPPLRFLAPPELTMIELKP